VSDDVDVVDCSFGECTVVIVVAEQVLSVKRGES
jgi:hypothetical protein